VSEPNDEVDVGTPTTELEGKKQPDDNSTPTSTTTVEEPPSPSTTPTTPSIPPGSLALFATISGGSQSDFLCVKGGNVAWDTTHYKFLRYIPEVQMLDEFGWTSSKSYSKTYIYGITAGDWVYEVKCFTDSGRKNITRLDPKTGDIVGRFGTITTGDMYRGFTISGDRVYYRTKVTKDRLGNWRGGGNVMAMEIGSTNAVEVLDYYEDDNQGRYYGIGNELITIITTYEDDVIYYDIYKVNIETMAIGELLYSISSDDHITFHVGTTSLFWSEVNPTTGDIDIIMFPLSEYPKYFLTISESTPKSLSIDESQGKVLVAFDDETPESPFYYLADIETGEVTELDVDPKFYSRSIYGNGQFFILE
jgi:hypothetical protein